MKQQYIEHIKMMALQEANTQDILDRYDNEEYHRLTWVHEAICPFCAAVMNTHRDIAPYLIACNGCGRSVAITRPYIRIEEYDEDYGWNEPMGGLTLMSIEEAEMSIPKAAILECTQGGRDASSYVDKWVKGLKFSLPTHIMQAYLRGAWDDLETCDRDTLTQRTFWVICGDLEYRRTDDE